MPVCRESDVTFHRFLYQVGQQICIHGELSCERYQTVKMGAFIDPKFGQIVVVGNSIQFYDLANYIEGCRVKCSIKLVVDEIIRVKYSTLPIVTDLTIIIWEENLLEIIYEDNGLYIKGDSNKLLFLASSIRSLCESVGESKRASHFHVEYYGGLGEYVSANTWPTVFSCDLSK